MKRARALSPLRAITAFAPLSSKQRFSHRCTELAAALRVYVVYIISSSHYWEFSQNFANADQGG